MDEESLEREFGNSKEMVKSVVNALQRKANLQNSFKTSLETAKEVGHCQYEHQTSWGKTVIFLSLEFFVFFFDNSLLYSYT